LQIKGISDAKVDKIIEAGIHSLSILFLGLFGLVYLILSINISTYEIV